MQAWHPSRDRDQARPPTHDRDQAFAASRDREQARLPTRDRDQAFAASRDRDQARPPTHDRDQAFAASRDREHALPASHDRDQARLPTRDREPLADEPLSVLLPRAAALGILLLLIHAVVDYALRTLAIEATLAILCAWLARTADPRHAPPRRSAPPEILSS